MYEIIRVNPSINGTIYNIVPNILRGNTKNDQSLFHLSLSFLFFILYFYLYFFFAFYDDFVVLEDPTGFYIYVVVLYISFIYYYFTMVYFYVNWFLYEQEQKSFDDILLKDVKTLVKLLYIEECFELLSMVMFLYQICMLNNFLVIYSIITFMPYICIYIIIYSKIYIFIVVCLYIHKINKALQYDYDFSSIGVLSFIDEYEIKEFYRNKQINISNFLYFLYIVLFVEFVIANFFILLY